MFRLDSSIKKNGRLMIYFLIPAAFLFFGYFAMAQTPDVGMNYVAETGLQEGADIRVMIIRVIQIALSFLGIIAVSIIMYAGWLWMTSEGDAGQIEKAKKTLINAAIGLVLILSAFSIVTFILNTFSDGPVSGTNSTAPNATLSGGAGALGSCSVESVYPEPGQTEPPVPRNTSIIISFKEEINVDTVISAGAIIPDRVRIFRTDAGDSCFWDGSNWTDCANSNVINVSASVTADHKTFVFTPNEYLGSGSETIEYTVYISNEVENTTGNAIFTNCQSDNMRWSFAVSNIVDLTPPQVKSVFPAPDNGRDTISSVSSLAAVGSITLSGTPSMRQDATCSFLSGTPGKEIEITKYDINSTQGGTLRIAVLPGGNEANLSNGATPLGTAIISGDTIQFGIITIRLTDAGDSFAAGDYWDFNATSVVNSDVLNIGGTSYYFVTTPTIPGQISGVGSVLENIRDAIMGVSPNVPHSSVASAGIVGTALNIQARTAGLAGNNITLETTSDNLILSGLRLSGGADNDSATVMNDKWDKKKNAVIKINFNEAMLPIVLTGAAGDLVPYISVKCLDIDGSPCAATDPGLFACGGDVCVDGKFVVSNQYRTVEFLSNLPCGVNGCGETRYCLPGNSQLRLDLRAASLEGCSGDGDCAPKMPFGFCLTGHCRNAAGDLYPTASLPFDGLSDVARNSLDGDADGRAEGGASYFDRNTEAGEGDSTRWSFFISNSLDETPPAISYIYPDTITPIPVEVSLGAPVQINFNELMMSSSLRTGTVNLEIGGEVVAHKALNMWSSAAMGYWNWSNDSDINGDEDFDITEVEIRHTPFGEYMNYNVQAGSALRDIYQNCFKRSTGEGSLDCGADNVSNPSCCSGTATAGGSCP